MKFRGNSVHVPVVYDLKFEDEWQFKTPKDKSQVENHIYVKAQMAKSDDWENIVLLFELVLLI